MVKFCPWYKHHFPLVLLMIQMKNAFCEKKENLAPSLSYDEMMCYCQFGLY